MANQKALQQGLLPDISKCLTIWILKLDEIVFFQKISILSHTGGVQGRFSPSPSGNSRTPFPLKTSVFEAPWKGGGRVWIFFGAIQ